MSCPPKLLFCESIYAHKLSGSFLNLAELSFQPDLKYISSVQTSITKPPVIAAGVLLSMAINADDNEPKRRHSCPQIGITQSIKLW